MYYYAPDNNRRGKCAGAIAVGCYLLIFAAVALLVSFRTDYEPASEGILIDFGEGDQGYGTEKVALAQAEQLPARRAAAGEEYLTQDTEEAPAIQTAPSDSQSHRRRQTDSNIDRADRHDTNQKPQEVNRRALFPGRSVTSEASSQGLTAGTTGNAGHESGGDGVSSGTGTGSEGISFSLAGRRPVGSLPSPRYDANDAQGKVVIQITVDARGNVQSASFHPQGSTTQDARLREAALQAARKARFTPSEANAVQTGTITYIFRLK